MTYQDDLTERVYEFVQHYIKENGISPTYREITKGAYLSLSSVQRHIDILVARNRLNRIPNSPRSLSIVQES